MRSTKSLGILLLLLAGTAALFACGLPGSFMLDDFPNLAGLEHARLEARRAGIYLTEGPAAAGFPGRALAYVSFLAQAGSWPGNPQAFKLVNIALHLLCGALAYFVVKRVLELAKNPRATGIAVIATAIWLVHPIQVSTVLYVVQRMTELAALFTLCGVLMYVRGRALALRGESQRGYAWMSAALIVAMPLAIMGKESGVLLPVFIAVLEFTLLARVSRPPRWKTWALVFLAAPVVALVAYLVLTPGVFYGYAVRDFDLQHRLYTEAIVLWDYLGKIVLPRPRAFGLYFDDYPVAQPPWRSGATAVALVGWAAAISVAIAWRRKLPLLSFAVLWYLAGHLLESTVLPLELYFEHRNYLALLGVAVLAGSGAVQLWQAASSAQVRSLYAALGAGAIAALSAVTWIEARAWSDPLSLALFWGHERPGSTRAQHDLGSAYMAVGRYTDAMQVFDRAGALAPGDAHFALARLTLTCVSDEVPLLPAEEAREMVARSPLRPGMISLLDDVVGRLEQGACQRIGVEYTLRLVDAFLTNPRAAGSYRRDALHLKARLHALQGNLDGAVRSLQAADEISPSLISVQRQAAWLLSADLHEEALAAIRKGRADPRWKPWQRALYTPLLDGWEKQVRESARAKGLALRAGS